MDNTENNANTETSKSNHIFEILNGTKKEHTQINQQFFKDLEQKSCSEDK